MIYYIYIKFIDLIFVLIWNLCEIKLFILGSNSNNRLFNELLECVDTGRSDYSFFNPRLLANWSGPKAWKDVAMAQSLRSLEPSSIIFKNIYSTNLYSKMFNK